MPSTPDSGRTDTNTDTENRQPTSESEASPTESEATSTEQAETTESALSRRRLLAAAGGSLLVGGTGGYLVGARPFAPPDCDALPVAVEDDEWSFPNHDRRHTATAPASTAPESLTEEWRVSWGVSNHGPPAVANDVAFVAAVEGNDRESLFAFDLRTGERAWRVPFPGDREARPVVAAGESVYYHTNIEDRGRTALALGMVDGRERWSDSIGDLHGYAPPLGLADGKVLLDDPTVREDGQTVVALDSETGEQCWQTQLDVDSLTPFPAVKGDTAYYVSRGGGEDASGSLVALNAATGAVTWETTIPKMADGPPVLGDDFAYVTIFDGPLVAVSLESGEEVWRHEQDTLFGSGDPGHQYAQPSYELGALTSSALVARLEAYTTASDRIRAFDPETGDVLWTRVAGGTDTWVTPPTAAGEAVFVAENREHDSNRLLRLDARTGTVRDSTAFEGWTHHGPVCTEAGALFVTGNGVVFYS
ncbi:outer membrane protein assembly factor BamB family protein [Halorussus ruber]|uniref:outer membrane protein assembly factor BamB family protein n=1 Tax=Halorussus ruber TaxID=1126238 RepID=UPI00109284A4|nr:PQQ-binding-like beta-propeller repeat protein [Halorussus ruber]